MNTTANILIVDDDPKQLQLLSELLGAEEYTIRPALSGEIALHTAAVSVPDLILLDLRMPGMDGIETCRRLKADSTTRHVPVIFISGSDDLQDKLTAFKEGGVDYVIKPFQEAEVLARVRTHLKLATVEELEREIEERKQVEEQLVARERFLRTLTDHLPGMVGYWTDELRCGFANQAYLEWFGRTQEQMIGITIQEMMGEELFRKNEQYIRRALQGETQRFERTLVKPSGETGYSWAHYIPDMVDGRARGFFVLVADVTELKHAEEERVRLVEKHHSILQSAMDGFWLVSTEGQLLEVNETYCRMSGYSEQELLAMHASDLDARESKEDTAAHIRKVMEVGHDRFVTRHMRKDRSSYDVEASVQYRADGPGEMVVFLRDISEQLRVEQQLQQAQKLESIGRLAGGVAHDFNNMLSVILGHAELGLMHLDPTSPVCADLMEIRKSAERSADLTRQLLAFARKQTVMPKVIDLNDTVTNMLKMLQRLIGEDIHLSWQPAPDQCQVKMDPSQIDQILANLCVNARDAIEDTGRITIETGTCSIDADYCANNPEASPGEYVRLAVSDDGKGMDRETQSHIFEPFFTTKGVSEGTGLGLATVYGAVKQNGGFINIYSEPGQGTTFSIHLPRYAENTVRKQTEDAAQPVPRGQETILLVEDEAAILNITAIMLEKQGYTVLRASSPGEAIQLTRDHHGEIHLLMTDVIMPEMNGRDLARDILTLHPGMKQLFMSGYTADIIAHHGVLDDGVHFIQKPFSLPNMAARVREVLDGNWIAIC